MNKNNAFISIKNNLDREKVFRHHKLMTLVICCKAVVDIYSIETSTIRSN